MAFMLATTFYEGSFVLIFTWPNET